MPQLRLSNLVSGLALVGSFAAVDPTVIYSGTNNTGKYTVSLKIGNGGAGQSGLVGALANAFIDDSVANGTQRFSVAWYTSDTTQSINFLKDGTVDVGITYTPSAEQVAIAAGIAKSPSYYIFRDHFLITGPPANPAMINSTMDVKTLFSALYATAEAGNATHPIRFLSRFDKSATNIKESELWIGIGQVPWATAYSTWYHQYIQYPLRALTAAIYLEEYTLTDRGTFLSLPTNLTSQTVIYKAATDDASDPLLNPAHLLIGTKATNGDMAQKFADWAVSSRGQAVITGFKKNGKQLYSGAP